jgi:hypothetical protein
MSWSAHRADYSLLARNARQVAIRPATHDMNDEYPTFSAIISAQRRHTTSPKAHSGT